jgi:class 3 adenylate cyclase
MFIEEPDAYLVTATEAGTLDPQLVSGIESAETTVLFQRMDGETLDAVVQSQGEMIDSKSYLGGEVFTTLQPISGHDVDWNVIVQIEREESLVTSNQAKVSSAIAVAIFVLLLTFVAVAWAAAFIRPIRVLSLRLQSLVRDEPESQRTTDLDKELTSTTREFAHLTATINEMLESLADREEKAALLAAEKRNVVRRFLPDDVARQVASGDRSIEQVEHATVVSVVIGGIGGLERHSSREVARDHVERMVDALDDAARSHGLRRVKVVGDVWIAVCGLDTPRVDHIARSVGLALDITSGGVEAQEDEGELDASVGVATGPVSAGLAGSGRLIFDAWGPTVTFASLLARTAPTGTVLVSEMVALQVPPDAIATQHSESAASEPVWRVDQRSADAGVPS